jgi:hypothetical protein
MGVITAGVAGLGSLPLVFAATLVLSGFLIIGVCLLSILVSVFEVHEVANNTGVINNKVPKQKIDIFGFILFFIFVPLFFNLF